MPNILYVFTPEQSAILAERITALTGETTDLAEALDQWEREHELIGELYANYDRFRIENTQLIKLVRLANIAIGHLYTDGGLFLKDKARKWHQAWIDDLEKINKQIPQILDPATQVQDSTSE